MKTLQSLCLLTLVLAGILQFSCSRVREAVDIRKPEANIRSVRISELTFDSANLVFVVAVNNPNNVSIRLNRFDYSLDINGREFMKGDQNQQTTIAANGETSVDIPLTIAYDKLYSTYRSLAGQDSTSYRAEIGMYLDVPVLGDIRVPVSREGYIPLVRAPQVNINSVEVEELRPTGADLRLTVMLDNPNGFELGMRRMNYEFLVSERTWASGTTREEVRISPNQRSTFAIPATINFLSVGQSVLRLLTESEALSYRFRGNILFQSPHPLIGEVTFPFDVTGKTEVKK